MLVDATDEERSRPRDPLRDMRIAVFHTLFTYLPTGSSTVVLRGF